ncbi:hypothetical protein Q8F55_005727 [Vanrija albida]|uniref:RRN6 beta-propeller domain-containing protein n=1 Tax=Vanrija albida TaxID=181172 RepID=A0ABR3Q2M8_9TREE
MLEIPSEIEPPKVIQTGSTDSLKHSAKHPLQVLIASSTKYIHDTPDIYEPDVIAEIVSQEIINSYPDLDNETFNARVDGRLLGVIQNPAIRKRPILLLSPSGDVGQLLSIMLFSQTLGKKRDAQPPTSHLAYAFQTPIRQIVCSSLTSPHRLDGCATALVVRLAGATHMLSVVPNPSFVSPTHDLPVTVATIGELPPSSTEGRCHVDVALDPLSWGKAAIVDEGGAVWLWSEQRETINGRVQRTYKVVKLRDSVAQAGDGFFRVAFGVRPGTVLVLSRRTLDMLDLEYCKGEINDFAQPAAVLDLTDFQKYIREFEAPPEHKLTAGELARSLNMDAAPTTRSSLLPKLGTVSRDTVTKLDDVDFASTFSSVWAVHSGTAFKNGRPILRSLEC